MNPIIKVLNITQATHKWMQLNAFSEWCGHHAHTHKEIQTLLSSQAIFNWFRHEYEMLELSFYGQTANFPQNQLLVLYQKTMKQIIGYHPPNSLLNKIKKQGLPNIINSISNLN